jgi:hypothetical protein
MRIQKNQFPINDVLTLQLNKRLNYPVHNIKTICLYMNRKAYMTNQRYLELIPLKVDKLKDVKNRLLHLRHELKQETDKPYFKQETILKAHNPKDYQFFKDLGVIKILDDFQQQAVYGVRREIKYKDINKRTKTRVSTKGNIKTFIEGLDYTIAVISDRIKELWNDYNKKLPFVEYNITSKDIYHIERGELTANVKAVSLFHLRNLRRKQISLRTYRYLNSPLVKETLDKYQRGEMINDINGIVEQELTTFEEWFLNKTI